MGQVECCQRKGSLEQATGEDRGFLERMETKHGSGKESEWLFSALLRVMIWGRD